METFSSGVVYASHCLLSVRLFVDVGHCKAFSNMVWTPTDRKDQNKNLKFKGFSSKIYHWFYISDLENKFS